MRQIVLILFFGIFQQCLANELPQDSAVLLEKLEEFEQNEHQKLKESIRSKRAQVAKLLEQHLQRETKSGNLERALLLKGEVERLTAEEDPASADMDSGASTNGSEEINEDWFVGKSWKKKDGSTVFKFEERGAATMTSGEHTEEKEWKIDRDLRGVAVFRGSSRAVYFWFDGSDQVIRTQSEDRNDSPSPFELVE
ncbi:MAG: hypothetical protein AAGA96_15175 [Verrucomicrobiota bacterium]